MHRLFLVAGSGGCFSLPCVGFSLWRFLSLQSLGSRCAGFRRCSLWALGYAGFSCGTQTQQLRLMGPRWASIVATHRFGGCGSLALLCELVVGVHQFSCSVWDLPRPGIEPMSPVIHCTTKEVPFSPSL